MNRWLLFPLLSVIGVVAIGADAPPYRLQPADTIWMSVWKEEELIREVVVLPDGHITFPLLGRLKVAGLTTTEAEEVVAERLTRFIPDPVVSVIVSGIPGNRFFIIGKVNESGMYVMDAPTDVLQALSFGGGFNKFADYDEILILRREEGELKTFSFDYGEVEAGKNLDSNILLMPNDVIIVP